MSNEGDRSGRLMITILHCLLVQRLQKERASREEKEKITVFGGAKPVDTASREREIEERLRKQNEEIEKKREERGRRGSER